MLRGQQIRAAIAAAVWIGLLVPLARLETSAPPLPQAAQASHAKPDPKKCEERDFWGRTVCDPVAGYTGMLALFTGVLTLVSIVQIGFLIRADKAAAINAETAKRQMAIAGQQTEILERQKEIQRQEFIATHRPRLRMRLLQMERPVLGKPIVVKYEVVNIGETNAQIVDNTITIRVDAVPQPEIPGDRPKTVQLNFTRQFHFANDLRQGEALPASGEITTFDPAWGFNGLGAWWENRLFIIGMIRYMDNNGVLRRTRFYRVATQDPNRFVFPQFETATALDHEYED